jgi:Holliday junction resolvase RusA-like endonuclease
LKSLECVIFTEPVAKGRPRSRVIAGHVQTYTPVKTRNAEAEIQALIRIEVMQQGQFDAGVPLKLEATFYRARPKHLPKRVTYPVQKPDTDNYCKLLVDALEKYVFDNDSQICTMVTRKRFCLPGQVPRIELKISEEE